MRLRPIHYSSQGRLAFQGFLCGIALCNDLRRFNIDFSICYVFGSDLNGLIALFLHDRELRFPRLENIVTTIASIPKLTEVQIDM
jgi:hypothetical protein